jgi:tetratricopeptide (TPR) repeat protein
MVIQRPFPKGNFYSCFEITFSYDLKVNFHCFFFCVSIFTVCLRASEVGKDPQVDQVPSLLRLAEQRALSVEECGKLALGYFSKGSFKESLTVLQLNLGRATTSQQKAFFYMLKAQNEAGLGSYRDAADSALKGQRFAPQSAALAWLRTVYCRQSGEQAEAMAAFDHLKRVDPNIPEPVMNAGELIKLTLAIAYTAWDVWKVVEAEWPKIQPHVERIAEALTTIWNGINSDKNPASIP